MSQTRSVPPHQRRQVPYYWIIWPEDRVLIAHQLEGANYKVITTV